MISRRSEFKLHERGFKETLLLIPGWAADYRIFDKIDLKFNYLIPAVLSTADFKERLIEYVQKNSLGKISILAWSMGVFLAADFICGYPDRVGGHVFFVGARKRYGAEAMDAIKGRLKKNRKGYLYRFYRECFCEEDKESLLEFKRRFLKSYLDSMTPEALSEGLDYLREASLVFEDWGKPNLIFIHGACDRIAPISEALQLKSELPQSGFVLIENAGHLPFLNPGFNSLIRKYVDR